MAGQATRKLRVLLAGNPNVGKSTLFNALTGLRQHTGNWPGKTVTVATGSGSCGGVEVEYTDLPGTYDLEGGGREERLAAEAIRGGEADCVVAVCDATCLERSLILALQILPLAERAVLCVNLADEARGRGITVDTERLRQLLGVPVVLTAAGKCQGLDTLQAQILHTATAPPMLCRDLGEPVETARCLAAACVTQARDPAASWRRELDRLLVSRRHGLSILFGLLLLIVWLSVWGANYPGAALEALLAAGHRLLRTLLAPLPAWLSGVLADGVYATAARVISVMLPPMAIFFPLFAVLEDVGYLPRMAFLLDHGMHRCGGCGKQALTLCMGLGCNVVGVMGCRIIESPKERLAAMLTNAMVPCNGRFPALIMLASLFFPGAAAALTVAACVALGMVGAMAASGVLRRTALRGCPGTFVMELPPFRRPRLGRLLLRTLRERTLLTVGRALRVAAPAGAVLWVLANTGLLQWLIRWLEPTGTALGMSGAILVAFLLSFPANELLLPVLLMILSGTGSLMGAAEVSSALLLGTMTWQTALCVMVFTLFHWPCAATVTTVYTETGSKKAAAGALMLPTAAGVVLCLLLRLILGQPGG